MKRINFWFKRKIVIRWLLAIAFLLSVFLVWLVFFSDRNNFDEKIFLFIGPHISEGRTRLMLVISFLGNHQFLIPANLLLIAIFIITKKKWEAIHVVTVSLSSLVIMSLLKNLFRRHRPDHPLVPGISNFSFPSGHAFMSAAFYGLLIWWAATYINNKWQRGITIILLMILILLIGFSRIYLRVHYASDVIAGLCIGYVCLSISLAIIERVQKKAESKKKSTNTISYKQTSE
jgi:membrane-associated phospholipid phosphatase